MKLSSALESELTKRGWLPKGPTPEAVQEVREFISGLGFIINDHASDFFDSFAGFIRNDPDSHYFACDLDDLVCFAKEWVEYAQGLFSPGVCLCGYDGCFFVFLDEHGSMYYLNDHWGTFRRYESVMQGLEATLIHRCHTCPLAKIEDNLNPPDHREEACQKRKYELDEWYEKREQRWWH